MDKIVIMEHSEKNQGRAEDYAFKMFQDELMDDEAKIVRFEYDPSYSFDFPGQLSDCCGKGGTLVVATIFELIWPNHPDFNQLYDVLEELHDRGIRVYSEEEPYYEWETCSIAIRALQLRESWKEYCRDED